MLLFPPSGALMTATSKFSDISIVFPNLSSGIRDDGKIVSFKFQLELDRSYTKTSPLAFSLLDMRDLISHI